MTKTSTGLLLAVYVAYHLMHFTFGNLNPDFIPGDAYHNVVAGFQSVPVVAVYLVALLLLAFHLYHGIWSALQTLGANHPKFNAWRRIAAGVFAVGLFVGFAVVPVAVLTGILK